MPLFAPRRLCREVMYEMAAGKRPAREKVSRAEQVFIGFMQSLGLHYAKHLLSQTDLSVKEIAGQLGFPEQFTFRKYFKRVVGVSPSENRKRKGEI